MAKRKSAIATGKPTKKQIATGEHIQKLVDAAARAQKESPRPQDNRCNPHRPVLRRPALTSWRPSPSTLADRKLSKPKSPESTTRNLDPLSASKEQEYLLDDKRHEHKGLIRIPAPARVNLPQCVYVRKGYFPLLDLPNEIKDSILKHVIPQQTYHLVWLYGHQRYKSLTYRLPNRGLPYSPCLASDIEVRRRLLRNPRCEVRNVLISDIQAQVSPVSLLWVCRALYEPASRMLYERSTFHFSSLRTLRHFLDRLQQDRKQLIKSLKLTYLPYGHPARADHKIWKEKADQAWSALCWRIREECPNLSSLNLALCMSMEPISFCPLNEHYLCLDFTKTWLYPLLAFKEIKQHNPPLEANGREENQPRETDVFRLDRLIFKINSYLKPDTVLEVESYNLRREILGNAWDEKRERSRDAFGYEKRTGKTRVLRIGC